jgi:hypothetical protein
VGGVSVSALSFILPCCMLMQLRRFHLAAYRAQLAFLEAQERKQREAEVAAAQLEAVTGMSTVQGGGDGGGDGGHKHDHHRHRHHAHGQGQHTVRVRHVEELTAF